MCDVVPVDARRWLRLMCDTLLPVLVRLVPGEEVGRVLWEISVTEQRYQAVLAVLGGVPVTEVAARFGVGRQSVHRWLSRYEAGGLEGLADRSHRPGSCPHQMDPRIEARVLELRRVHRSWGARRIRFELGKLGVAPVPSESGVYRALVWAGRHRCIMVLGMSNLACWLSVVFAWGETVNGGYAICRDQ